ncbi:MAG: flagellar hook basal-body protein [Planctomycetota bacterium]
MTNYGESILVRAMSFLAEKQAGIANNLANVDTASFKRRIAVARESGHDFESLLDKHLPAIAFEEKSDMGRGILRDTGNKFDVALDGPFWLRVQNAKGESFYTRNGQLQVDQGGRLVTRDGMALLDTGGAPIEFGSAESAPSDLVISPNGTLSDSSTGQTWGPIAVVELPDQQALHPIGRGLYVDAGKQAGKQAGDGVKQGFLEGSNVDSLQELVAMITVERSFAATQKALSGVSRLQESIISNILR